jgi:hypothetical protein
MNRDLQTEGASALHMSACLYGRFIRSLHRWVSKIGDCNRREPSGRGIDCRRGRQLAAVMFFLLVCCSTKRMTIAWQDTSENEQGFRVYRITSQQKTVIAEVGPNVTQYTDSDAPPDACYIVTAFNAAGESAATNSACRPQ